MVEIDKITKYGEKIHCKVQYLPHVVECKYRSTEVTFHHCRSVGVVCEHKVWYMSP